MLGARPLARSAGGCTVVTRTKQLRLLAIGLALALTLAAAGPAVAASPASTDGWLTSGIDHIARWWTTVWGMVPGTTRAASEVLPHLDPNGVAQPPEEPDGSTLQNGEESGGGNEVWPRLDPDG